MSDTSSKREVIARRVAEADPSLEPRTITEALETVAGNPRALAVLATALAPGPKALSIGAPPLVSKLVRELRARGSGLAEPRCRGCGRAHHKLTASEEGGLCPRCRHRQLASTCHSCGVLKPIGGRGRNGEALCAACAPRPRRPCSICGRTRVIARRENAEHGDICDSCYKGPLATCRVCHRLRPCNFVAAGRPICASCSPRRSLLCAHCAKVAPPCARWPEGPVCEPCYRAALSRRGRCAGCREHRRLVAPPGPKAAICADCARVAPLACCRTCGVEDRPYLNGSCVRCALAERTRQLIGDVEGPLRPVYEAIVAAPKPYSAHNWLRSSAGAAVLGELASGTLVLSHEALDAHPRRRGADYLRHLLVANGVLEPRNDELARLEVWIAAYLQSVENAAERRLLRSYARWRVLRRARRRAEGSDRAARTPTRHAKNCLKAATAFLAFLARRGHDLSGCTQADLDAWLASGPNASNVADFLDWAASARHLERFSVSSHGRQRGQPLDEDSYWACARRLLHDDSCELTDRVAGSLVLLYGQQLSRIVTLRKDQLSIEGGKARLRLGTTPIELPPPLDRLAARLASERRPHSGIGSPATSPWLFTGLDPGRPLSAYQLGQRLRHLGVDPPAARRAALGHLAGQLPAAFLASLLGVTAATAVRWVQAAGGDWNAYAAQIARRQ